LETPARLIDLASSPSEISAIVFKGNFSRFEIYLISVTIDVDWSIFSIFGDDDVFDLVSYHAH
jgi:hypothetical protein